MGLNYEKRGRIAYITIDRPQVMNAMNREVFSDLAGAIDEVDRDQDVWVAIVSLSLIHI